MRPCFVAAITSMAAAFSAAPAEAQNASPGGLLGGVAQTVQEIAAPVTQQVQQTTQTAQELVESTTATVNEVVGAVTGAARPQPQPEQTPPPAVDPPQPPAPPATAASAPQPAATAAVEPAQPVQPAQPTATTGTAQPQQPVATRPARPAPRAATPDATTTPAAAPARHARQNKRRRQPDKRKHPAAEPTQASDSTDVEGGEPPNETGGASAPGATVPQGSTTLPPLMEEPDPITRVVENVREVLPGWLQLSVAITTIVGICLGVISLILAKVARALRTQRKTLLADIGFLQQALLPSLPESCDGLNVTVAYKAASGLVAGGDFYEVFTVSRGRTAIILGDVSGHGKDAIAHAALMRHTIRAYLEAGLQPANALELAGQVAGGALGDQFATVIVAVYERRGRLLTFASAGHPWPIDRAGQIRRRGAVCPPLGLGLVTGGRQTSVILPAGEPVLLFTDGLTEARMADNSLLGEDGLRDLLQRSCPGGTARQLLDAVTQTAARTTDDMAACVFSPTGEGPGGGWSERIIIDKPDISLRRLLDDCDISDGERQEVTAQAAQLLESFERVVVEVHQADRREPADVAVFPLTDTLPDQTVGLQQPGGAGGRRS